MSLQEQCATEKTGTRQADAERTLQRNEIGTAYRPGWLRASFLSPTTTLPALSMPAGFTSEGMPVGLQLVGPPRGEARLLQLAPVMDERLGPPVGPIDPV
ncbi:MAG: amidase family protein [Pseudomonadota bacterium]